MAGYYLLGSEQSIEYQLDEDNNAANTKPSVKKNHKVAKVIYLDGETQKATDVFNYVCPAKWRHEDGGSCFKSGHKQDHYLYLCTDTEVLIYDLEKNEVAHHISHPYFNDLHHVRPYGNNVLVVSTGLESLLEVDLSGKLINLWEMDEQTSVFKRFSKDEDFRKLFSTKPHSTHANFTEVIGKDIWVSRLKQRDFLNVTSADKTTRAISEHTGIHDGIVIDNMLYHTAVNGLVIRTKVTENGELTEQEVFDLNENNKEHQPLGWCRSINIINEELVMVGFSRFRPTTSQSNISWAGNIKSLITGNRILPSRICLYSLKERKIIKEINIEKFGLSTIYSILDA